MRPAGILLSQNFAELYYKTFDSERAGLAGLYTEQSLLCFDGDKFQGVQAVMAKLTSYPASRVEHQMVSIDSHALPNGGLIVFVTGRVLVSFSAAHHRYVQAAGPA